ncbi:MAG: hypothetical protein ACD_4C00358G0001 [uncultured bacterium (gcode 4)]|uniref:Uncharacterized protein n=1 Tax=uncultured bacterium (gcode 4) TaxID=1234023 RepID=K2FTL3_9BACT|nr:MAG: hypothetical protein ACD_4C00358G0001 [uncultured bacterium (gcode 4)]
MWVLDSIKDGYEKSKDVVNEKVDEWKKEAWKFLRSLGNLIRENTNIWENYWEWLKRANEKHKPVDPKELEREMRKNFWDGK